jgi:FMN phosphatase YigB (HAD superfamily)
MKAVVFDAYGTLFDVHSVVLRDGHNITGDVQTLSTLWRQGNWNTRGCDPSWNAMKTSGA